MKVFLSWSKDLSHDVAEYFAEWLPSVIQECSDPFISSDIDKGEPWFETITASLVTTDLGLVFITPENQESTWLNFEAGAMINKFGKSGVCPILVDLKKGNYTGPMKNLQLSELDSEQDMKLLLATINKKCSNPLDAARLERMFDVFWGELQTKTQELMKKHKEKDKTADVVRSIDDKLDELLTLARGAAANESTKVVRDREFQSLVQEVLHRALIDGRRFDDRRIDDHRRWQLEDERQALDSEDMGDHSAHHEQRLARFKEKYGSLEGYRKSDQARGTVVDFGEKGGKLYFVSFQLEGSKKLERLRADEVEIFPF